MGSNHKEETEADSILMVKVVYNVQITGQIEIDTDTLQDHEIDRDHPDKRSFDIARYLKLITSTIERSHPHWNYTTSYSITHKQVYNRRGIPTSEPIGEGCCG